jgi:hypothetical protein
VGFIAWGLAVIFFATAALLESGSGFAENVDPGPTFISISWSIGFGLSGLVSAMSSLWCLWLAVTGKDRSMSALLALKAVGLSLSLFVVLPALISISFN